MNKRKILIFFLIMISTIHISAQETIIGVLNDSRVRIRKAPDLNSEQIGYLYKDQIISIIDKTKKTMKIEEMESVWYKIIDQDGNTGWVYGHFIDTYNPEITIKFNPKLNLARFNDENIIENDKVFDIQKFEEIFKKPINNINVETNFNKRLNIKEISKILKIIINKDEINNNLGYYEEFIVECFDLKTALVHLADNNNFGIFFLEYNASSKVYNYKIKIGETKDEILNLLGDPSYLNEKVFIYNPKNGVHNDMRQINIFFNAENKVEKVQIISWGGV